MTHDATWFLLAVSTRKYSGTSIRSPVGVAAVSNLCGPRIWADMQFFSIPRGRVPHLKKGSSKQKIKLCSQVMGLRRAEGTAGPRRRPLVVVEPTASLARLCTGLTRLHGREAGCPSDHERLSSPPRTWRSLPHISSQSPRSCDQHVVVITSVSGYTCLAHVVPAAKALQLVLYRSTHKACRRNRV